MPFSDLVIRGLKILVSAVRIRLGPPPLISYKDWCVKGIHRVLSPMAFSYRFLVSVGAHLRWEKVALDLMTK